MNRIKELNEQGKRDDVLNNEAIRTFEIYLNRLQRLKPILGTKNEYNTAVQLLNETISNLNKFKVNQQNELFEIAKNFSKI